MIDLDPAMRRADLDELERELDALCAAVLAEPLLSVRVELALLTTGHEPSAVATCVPVREWPRVTLRAAGGGSLDDTLARALAALHARRRQCRANGVDLGAMWLWLVTPDAAAAQLRAGASLARVAELQQAELLSFAMVVPVAPDAAPPRRTGARWCLVRELAHKLRSESAPAKRPEGRANRVVPGAWSSVFLRGLGREIRLAETLHEGSRGTLRAIAATPDLVAKLYSRGSELDWLRIEHLVASPPTVSTGAGWGVAWPIDVVLSATGARLGFVMPRVTAGRSLPHVYCERLRRHCGRATDARQRAAMATALARAVAAIHLRPNVVLGGLDERSVLVSDDDCLWLTNLDDAQLTVDGRLVPVARCGLDYLPPELLAGEWPGRPRRQHDDCFALAVLVHALLLDGRHPFDALSATGLAGVPRARLERQRRGAWPGNTPGLLPPPGSVAIESLGAVLCAMFERALVPGIAGGPTAAEWAAALAQHESLLVPCAAGRGHWRRAELPVCPYCER